MLKRITALTTSSVMIVMLTACWFTAAGVNALKGAVKAFGPYIADQIKRGNITPEKAKLYTDDANLLIDDTARFAASLGAATTGAEKITAVGIYVNEVAPISSDFAKIPQLDNAMLIFNTALAVVQAFYGGTPPKLKPGVSAPAIRTEKELKDYLDQQSKLLKLALAAR